MIKPLMTITLLFLYACSVQAQPYELVWADEFRGDALNETNWEIQIGDGCAYGVCDWGNNEAQYYRAENIDVVNGNLVITGLNEAFGGKNYTSGRIRSSNKIDFRYGRVAVRAKLPAGTGTWAAIWMLPTDWTYGGWPQSGEIDIMEYVGYDPGVVHSSLHTIDSNFQNAPPNPITESTIVPTAESQFHEYSLEWTPTAMHFYVDSVLYHTYNNPNTGWQSWPFDQRFHLLINLAIGGSWGGYSGIDNGAFPAQYLIDYVRVYQQNPATSLPYTALTFPGTVEAEHYDDGGAGVAYYDTDNGNNGDLTLRNDDVDLSTGPSHVGYFGAGEWLEYTVDVPESGLYSFSARVATPNNNTELMLGFEETGILVAHTPANTGGWNNWQVQTINGTYSMQKGTYTMRIYTPTGGFNLDYIEAIKLTESAQSPFSGTAQPVPGIIEMETYDAGGNGTAYFDATAGNLGGSTYRGDDVDMEVTSDVSGNVNIGWIDAHEWWEYTVDVANAGQYDFCIRMASPDCANPEITIAVDDSLFTLSGVPATGAWNNWVNYTMNNVVLPAGIHELRIATLTGGLNLNYIDVKEAAVLPVHLLQFAATPSGNNVAINWQTADEQDSDYFVVERSDNGSDFYALTHINSKGTVTGINTYHAIDLIPTLSQTNYYRLQMVDKDGSIHYSKVVAVNFSISEATIYPNPFQHTLTIEAPAAARIIITNSLGQHAATFNVTHSGQNTIDLRHYSSGVYFVTVQYKETTQRFKVVKR